MKKIFLLTLIMVLTLTSCNLPSGSATPSVDVIATRVAGTLAASQTAAAIVQPTSQLPTIALETATPEPTATATVTPTATVNPDDPKLTLGTPDYTFNAAVSGDPFGVVGNPYEDNFMVISQQVGGLNFTSKAVNGGKRWRLSPKSYTNFYVEDTFKINTCSGRDNYGIAMRFSSYTSFEGYFVGLSCDGSYIVDRTDKAGDGYNIISWTPDVNIKTGNGQTNRIGVMLINDTFKIYINGVKVKEFTDGTITNAGHNGAYASCRENPNFNVELTELLVWEQ